VFDLIRSAKSDGSRHALGIPYLNQEMSNILAAVERETGDSALSQSIFFSPTALTHIKRLIDMGGSIITDTTIVMNEIDESLLGSKGARILCFIDDPRVVTVAEQRHVTRAEIAVDYGLAVSGPKLMVVGSAPAAIQRILARRQHEPMSDVCVLAAPNSFASAVQLKERLLDSDMATIIARGKKGGTAATAVMVNAILNEIAKGNR
jgi:precorrin-8X/cobalt-precorrin-8 methylmutase